MNKIITKNILPIAGIIIGALGGYLYWKFVGCNSGNCMITSKPVNSTVYGAVLVLLIIKSLKSNT